MIKFVKLVKYNRYNNYNISRCLQLQVYFCVILHVSHLESSISTTNPCPSFSFAIADVVHPFGCDECRMFKFTLITTPTHTSIYHFTVRNAARNLSRLVSLCSDRGTLFDLNVMTDWFALASEVI